MVKEILTAAGVTFRRSRFPKPPAETYAIYFDDFEVDGADPVTPLTEGGLPGVQHHDVEVQVYEPHPDDDTEQAIEAALNARGIPWAKEDREWLQDTQRYQVVYSFTYITK